MKSYAKVIEAEQFNGDIESLKLFVGPENQIIEEEGKVILVTEKDRWNVVSTDYVARGYYGLLVFKEQRFLDEFKEVFLNEGEPCIPNEQPELKYSPELHNFVPITPQEEFELDAEKPVTKKSNKKE